MSKVSIIIPAFNEEKYIKKTLEAVSKLDYPDYEIIVVDNGSTDMTSDIVKTFSNVQLVQISERGLTKAREAGRHAATGEIIAQLDADSIVEPMWLQKGVSLISKKGVVAVSGPYKYTGKSNCFGIIAYIVQIVIYTPINSIMQLLGRGAVLVGSNIFIKKTILTEIGGYDTSISFYGEDSDIALRVSKLGKVIFSPTLYVYSSARRFEQEGIIYTFYTYIINFFAVMFKKNPTTKEYKNYR